MSSSVLIVLVTIVVALLAVFVVGSVRGLRRSPRAMMPHYGSAPDPAEGAARLEAVVPGPLRILVATDGSRCGDRAVQSVAARPWPAGSRVEVVSVVHTNVPEVPDPQLMIEAAHIEGLEADRQRAPGRVERAVRHVTTQSPLAVTGKVLEGDPERALLGEAAEWGADLIVVGSHGRGRVARRFLGSVSQGLALHAGCSVEIVRCRETPD